MKKIIFIIALMLTVCSTAMADSQAPANNQIFYTSSDGNIVAPNIAGIESNTYENGQGIITFNSEITSIKEYAFDKCSTLTSIILPSGVQSIGVGAFRDCENLTGITIPSTVSEINQWAFIRCKKLTSIVIPNGVTSIGIQTFEQCCSLTSVSIPNSVKTIESRAFWGCTSLTNIIIPSSVTSLGYDPFEACSNLTEIFLLGTTPPSIGEKAFDWIASNAVFVIPDGTMDTYKNSGWSNLNLITFSEYKQQKENDIILPNELKAFLTLEEIQDFETYKSNFHNASTQVDAYLWKVRAMGIIAVAEIKRDMGSDRNIAYLNHIIQSEMAAIRTAETEADINRIKSAISAKLVEGRNKYAIYKDVVAEEFGSLLTEQNGPAIEGESEDGQTIKLYKVKNVKFSKEEE